MVLFSAIVLLALSESVPTVDAFAPSTPSARSTTHLFVGNNGRSFEQRDRFDYETDFADRIGGTPNPDSWAQPVNGVQKRRRGIPYRTAIANAKAAGLASPETVANNYMKDTVKRSVKPVQRKPETVNLKKPVNTGSTGNPSQVRPSTAESVQRSTVNGMYNYDTDFSDRVGSAPDVDIWSRPVNGRLHNRQYRRGVPASSVPPAVVPKRRANPNTIQMTQKNRKSLGMSGNRSTVNGMYNYDTDFADRIGSCPDVDAWSRPARNGMKNRKN